MTADWYDDSSRACYLYRIPLGKVLPLYNGQTPVLCEDGKTVTYGLYPQTNVNDSDLLIELNKLTTPESNGWYCYQGRYYAKTSAAPYRSDYVFDNGVTISEDTTYWFKCEPINWNILSNTEGEYYIVSSVLLDAQCYYHDYANERTIGEQTIYQNNYKYSDIRAWLNEDFYNSAFALGSTNIQTTTVDNSASTTISASNQYACDPTEDKIFLPSYKDYTNASYGFTTTTSETETRQCKTTDWARARGVMYSKDAQYLYNGAYWTRSPHDYYKNNACRVFYSGNLYNDHVDRDFFGVRPALNITIA